MVSFTQLTALFLFFIFTGAQSAETPPAVPGIQHPTTEQLEICARLLGALTGAQQGRDNPGFSDPSLPFRPEGDFLSYLAAKHLDWNQLDHGQREVVFARYFIDAAAVYNDPVLLRREQNVALGRALSGHGVQGEISDARARLVELSAANRRRLTAEGYASVPEMKEAEQVVGNLDFHFLHHTNSAKQIPATPLVSSARLESLGLGGGLNTGEFGRDVMKGDDQVYFWVTMRPKGQAVKDSGEMAAFYGRFPFELSKAYAQEAGWVSIYIMYPSDLEGFAKQQMGINPSSVQSNGFLLARDGAKFREMQNGLQKFDFTTSDFEATVKEQMLKELNRLRASGNTSEVQRLFKQLSSNNADERQEAFTRLVAEPWKIKGNFELKVPTAVPENVLERANP